ncbi:CHAT domain-containing protein [Edaphobacter aggregans]|uniref:CHAT domain-containing protein n=1 Tax=Edaphobacter aggregans TaxID=570835 RepID=UPI00163A77C1|nr:CHAT domain-containing protein [Edaphobacter aggregans]
MIEAEIARLSAQSSTVTTDGYEISLNVATENLLPHWSNSPEARAKISQTAALGLSHHDRWLFDWIAANHSPISLEADYHLAAAVAYGEAGEAESSLTEARRAIELYTRANEHPGLLRAQFAEIYAFQRLGRAKECLQSIAIVKPKAALNNYAWLQSQLFVELGDCEGHIGKFEATQEDLERALALSKVFDLPLIRLRALSAEASFLDLRGMTTSAWRLDSIGLLLCRQLGCPPLRRYEFMYNMVMTAERLELPFVAGDIMRTGAHLAALFQDATEHAYALETLGTVIGQAGEYTESTQAFTQALAIARAGKQGPMSPLYQADWQIDRAEILSRQGAPKAALRLLEQNGPILLASDYQPARLHYLTQLASVDRSLGHTNEALTNSWMAVREAEHSLGSLHTTTEREQWSQQNKKAYAELVRCYLQLGEDTEALRAWERFRSAPYISTSTANLMRSSSKSTSPNTMVLVLARIDDSYIGWIAVAHPLRVVRTISLGEGPRLQQMATIFIRLCSDPNSNLNDVKVVGSHLYSSLLQPLGIPLNIPNHLWIDVDPSLGAIPFSALLLPSGDWLGSYSQISVLPAWWVLHPATSFEEPTFTFNTHMVVASGFGAHESLQSPVGSSEAAEIARFFPGATLIDGPSANTQVVLQSMKSGDIFHFSGHATSESGTQLLLGSSDGERPNTLTAGSIESIHLRHCKVAVLAACNTNAANSDQIENSSDLRNAFLIAGANSVVASNWDVDDKSTHILMMAFYNQLVIGVTPAQSLQTAQQSLRNGSTWQHPYYWASFEIFTN